MKPIFKMPSFAMYISYNLFIKNQNLLVGKEVMVAAEES